MLFHIKIDSKQILLYMHCNLVIKCKIKKWRIFTFKKSAKKYAGSKSRISQKNFLLQGKKLKKAWLLAKL